jgi:hypothetical protein
MVPRKWKKEDVKTTQLEWNGSRPDFLQRDMTTRASYLKAFGTMM